MEVHVALPTYGDDCSASRVLEYGIAVEELGFDGIASTDHLIVPPGNPERFEKVLEAITVLAALATRTRRVKLVTAVIVLPMRSPFVVAKQIATVDQFSGGRVILGLGAGWNEEEFNILGADFHTRGRRLDEGIRLIRHLFSGSREAFDGSFYPYRDAVFGPLPSRRDKLPILIGGTSDAALRRAASAGDLWESNPVISPQEYPALLSKLRSLAGNRTVEAGARINIAEGAQGMLQQAMAYRRAGAEHLTLEFFPFARFGERVQEFAVEVLPALRS
jgi:probable F420-dependent oxidoreductase